MSDWIHSSATLPSAIRKTVIPDVVRRFPVGAAPKYGPSLKLDQDVVARAEAVHQDVVFVKRDAPLG